MSEIIDKPIVVMAGGTGGHVFPALAVAEKLRQRGEKVVWFGTRNGIEARVVPAADFAIEWLSVQGLRGKGLLSLLLAPVRLTRACWQALRMLQRNRPKAVLGMGGFVSGPGGLVAWFLNIPLFLHEQNSIMGLTNKVLSRFATRNYFAFPDAAESIPRSECIGNPTRASFENLPQPDKPLQARIGKRLRVLVVGGSLGAVSLNQLLPKAIACLDLEHRPHITHQCGVQHANSCAAIYRAAQVEAEVVSFIDNMAAAYEWADLVISRSGAMTIAELMAVGRAALLIPYPHAVDNHQYYNARYLERREAAQIIVESELSAESLALKLKFFQQNRSVLVQMARRARALNRADAADHLVQGILAGASS